MSMENFLEDRATKIIFTRHL